MTAAEIICICIYKGVLYIYDCDTPDNYVQYRHDVTVMVWQQW
jgi:hypothetical protein